MPIMRLILQPFLFRSLPCKRLTGRFDPARKPTYHEMRDSPDCTVLVLPRAAAQKGSLQQELAACGQKWAACSQESARSGCFFSPMGQFAARNGSLEFGPAVSSPVWQFIWFAAASMEGKR